MGGRVRALLAVAVGVLWLAGTVSAVAQNAGPGANACTQVTRTGDWSVIAMPSFPENVIDVGSIGVLPVDPVIKHHAVDPADPDVLWITDGYSVLRSADRGCSWNISYTLPELVGPAERPYNAFTAQIVGLVTPTSPSGTGRAHAIIGVSIGTFNKQYVMANTADAGASWQDVTVGLLPTANFADCNSPEDVFSCRLVVAPSNPDVLYLMADGGTLGVGPASLFRSDDGGQTWLARSPVYPGDPAEAANLVSGDPTELVVSPENPDHLAVVYTPGALVDSGGLLRSFDGGFTWAKLSIKDGERVELLHAARKTDGGVRHTGLGFPGEHNTAVGRIVSDDGVASVDSQPAIGLPDSALLSAAHGVIAATEVVTADTGMYLWSPDRLRYENHDRLGLSPLYDVQVAPPEALDPAISVDDLVVSAAAEPRVMTYVFRRPGSLVVYQPQTDPGTGVPIPPRPDPGEFPPIGSRGYHDREDLTPCPGPGSAEPEPQPAALTVRPDRLSVPLGETVGTYAVLGLAPRPTPVDVYFLIDSSSSMGPVADSLEASIEEGAEDLVARGIDVHVGLAEFGDFTTVAYRRLVQVGPVDCKLPRALGRIRTSGGDENHLIALHQSVTGSGWRTASIPEDKGAIFRPGTLRLVIHATDEPVDDDPREPPRSEVVRTMREAGARHVGIHAVQISEAEEIVLASTTRRDLDELSARTGALAPAGGIDCNGDGIPDLQSGEPVVCAFGGLGDVAPVLQIPVGFIVAQVVDGLRTTTGVRLAVLDDKGLDVDITDTEQAVDLADSNVVGFPISVRCTPRTQGREVDLVIGGQVAGVTVAQATVPVACSPGPPAPLPGLPPIAAAVVPVLIPPPVPAPAPVPVPVPAPAPATATATANAQATATASALAAAPEEELEVAEVGIMTGPSNQSQESLAMTRWAGAAALTMAAGYALRRQVSTRRNEID